MIKHLEYSNVGDWVIYRGEQGRIKHFRNNKQIAWVVYDAKKDWKDQTGKATQYANLTFKE